MNQRQKTDAGEDATAASDLTCCDRLESASLLKESGPGPRNRISIAFLPPPSSGDPGSLPQAPWEEEEEESERDNALFEILSVHEDLPTALRAGRVIRRLKSGPAGPRFEVNHWSLEALRDPVWKEMAAEDAKRAAMVFLSLHGTGELSPFIRSQLDLWLGQPRMQPCALVLSLDAEAKGSRMVDSVTACFRAAAASFDAELFVHFEDPPLILRTRDSHRPPARTSPKPPPR